MSYLSSCVEENRCDDNRNKNNINLFEAETGLAPSSGARQEELFGAEDILNLMINSAQNASCPDNGSICCAKKLTKDFLEDFSNYEPEPCEKFSLDGEIAGTYSKTIQAEKFNYR